MRIRKECYKKWFSLFTTCKWLENLSVELAELAEFCANTAEQVLVCDLIRKLEYVTPEKRQKCLRKMAKQIMDNWGLNPTDTIIVSPTKDYDPDSAQMILQLLKPLLSRNGWQNVKMINQFGKCLCVENVRDYRNIVFMDEFIGTGTSICNRIRDYRTQYDSLVRSKTIPDNGFCVKVCILACMEFAKPVITSMGAEIYSAIWLKKGITENYTGQKQQDAFQNMNNMEQRLDQTLGRNYFPYGYGRSETLYAMEDGNAVNNMFPLFWWPYLKNRKQRRVLFSRKER